MNAITWGEISKMDKKEVKEAIQEAIGDWLDQKFSQFGKWSLASIAAAALAALMYFIVSFGSGPKN